MIQTEFIYTVTINTNPELPTSPGTKTQLGDFLRGIHQEGHGDTCVFRGVTISTAGNRHVLWTTCGRRGSVATGMEPHSEGILSFTTESLAQLFVVIKG